MTTPVKDRRPRAYPAPEFPPRKPKLFARTPPAIFPSLLGLLGLGLAARKAAGKFVDFEALIAAPGVPVEALKARRDAMVF